jgi:pimeloyl-ACP methyl ester carboxylesterase
MAIILSILCNKRQSIVSAMSTQLFSTYLSNGFSLRYLRAGRGRPLVLLHTIRTQLDYFEQLVPALKSQYQIYVLDLPGHGQSSLLATEYTEELLRKSVTEFIQQLNLRDVTLVGESIGAVLALTVSAELPDRVGGHLRESETGRRSGTQS